MKEIIECVPNFSEGRNQETINAIAEAIKNTPNCKLLNVEPDRDYNRVVVTFVGTKEGVLNGAINASVIAAERIDMTQHKGEHPRIGAIDVVPFIPIKNASIEDCVEISKQYGKIISEKLNIPVYLYEYSATKPERKNLADIRKGEYEGLKDKLLDPNWYPDFGKPEFNPKLGATVTGCRFFLIAYNVNLKTTDVKIADEIAGIIRESGKPMRDEQGNVVKKDGKTVRIPGKFKAVKAMGVSLEKFGITQVSINLVNYKITNMHQVFEAVKEEASKFGVETWGSEIVGLVPLEAILEAGKFYNPNSDNENELINTAIEKLGLSNLAPFNPKEKIIEYLIEE
ncbi:MAG: glutamate formimidoyltransferase [Ignavibacteria bacterium]|nr:glutamate formimidoyltransferase [Ignavibacteria bacterium]